MIISLKTNQKKTKLIAHANYDLQRRKFIVLKGSKTSLVQNDHFDKTSSFPRRELMLSSEIDSQGVLIKDAEFNSQSQAACVISGQSVSGNTFWVTDSGITLGEYLQLGILDKDVTLDPNEVQYSYLIDFLKNIDVLESVLPQNEFNVFQTLKIVTNEIRHSNVIAWLLNPNESHGLKDHFVKKFIRSIYSKNHDKLKDQKLDGLYLWDFTHIDVLREKDNIDILLVDNYNGLIVAIENKINSKENGNQLFRYKEIVKNNYSSKDFKYIFVYLTVNQEESSEEVWVDESYKSIAELIESIQHLLTEKVQLFVRDYLQILRREIMEDEKLIELCKEIYRKHKNALDLIYEYKPDIYLEISEAIKTRIHEEKKYTLNDSGKTIVRFSTPIISKINDYFKDKAGVWVKDKSMILYEIKISESKIHIMIVVGPSKNQETRNRIIDFYFSNFNEKKTYTSEFTRLKTLELMRLKIDKESGNKFFELEEVVLDKIYAFTQEIDKIFEVFTNSLFEK